MKILFCSLSDRPILSKPMFQQLEQYCNKHDYKCVLEDKILDKSRSPSWSKIKLLQREMNNNPDYDIIVWVDDDILITNTEIKFEELIKSYSFDNILISEDVVESSPFNCGVLVCKNNKQTYNYLKEIWELCEKYPKYKFNGYWEQDIITIHYKSESFQKSSLTIIPHNIIQSFYRDYAIPEEKKWRPGQFSVHLTGMHLLRRIQLRDEILSIIS